MNANTVVAILKRLAGVRPDDLEASKAALEAVSTQLNGARAEFSAAQAGFGPRLIAAIGEGKAEELEADLDAKRRLVERLERASEELARKVRIAQDVASAADLASRWDAAEVALSERRSALVKLCEASAAFGRAYLAAEEAARVAWVAIPRDKFGTNPNGLLTSDFTDLSVEFKVLLSLATEGRIGGHVGSGLWTIRQRPALVERADMRAAEWLRLRPKSEPEPPPKAA